MISQESAQSSSSVPLGPCLVIESRHSSRCEIVSTLTASKAFSNVVHAATVSETVVLLRSMNFDVCLIGPKTALPRVLPGVATALQSSDSKNCVLMAFSNDEIHDPEYESLLAQHNVILRPYSKSSLSEAVVHEVVKSRGENTWVGVRFNNPPEIDLPVEKSIPSAGTETANGSSDSAPAAPRLICQVFSLLGTRLKTIAQDGARGIYMLTPSGVPSQVTKNALDKIIFGVVCELEKHGPVAADFQPFLTLVIYQWFSDYVLEGAKTASQNLQSRLTNYVALNSQPS